MIHKTEEELSGVEKEITEGRMAQCRFRLRNSRCSL
jgi:hypothetical protein